MVDAKQLKTQELSWFWPGAVRSAVVCSGHYIAQHRSAVVGQLQARRERRRGLQVPGEAAEDVVGELKSVCMVSCGVFSFLSRVPCDGGVHLPFIGQGEGELQACRTIQLHGGVWRAPP
jgi:hypothetical protein